MSTTDAEKAAGKKREREAHEAVLEGMQAEEDARNAAAKVAVKPDVNHVPAVVPKPIQIMPRDRQDERSARAYHDVTCPAGMTPEQALDPRALWTLQTKINRYDEVFLHDANFRWEGRFRVMKKDPELQTIELDPIGPDATGIARHDITKTRALDFTKVKIEHRGTAMKWVVANGTVNLKTGFETREEAEEWLARRASSNPVPAKAAA